MFIGGGIGRRKQTQLMGRVTDGDLRLPIMQGANPCPIINSLLKNAKINNEQWRNAYMTKVICRCDSCIHNKNGECTKSVIVLEESDDQWKDCDSSKVDD